MSICRVKSAIVAGRLAGCKPCRCCATAANSHPPGVIAAAGSLRRFSGSRAGKLGNCNARAAVGLRIAVVQARHVSRCRPGWRAGECGATDAVLLDAVILPDQNKVVVTPPATLRCPMAEQIAQWVRDDVAPSVLKFGSPLRGLDNFNSYECRGRNRVRGAQLSEHGKANALDVRLFKLANGQSLTLTDVNVNKDWREAIKASVCARFATILGPGSDGSHEEHIHLDLAQRRNNYKVCEWDVRSAAPPPVVQAKSQDAAPAASAAPQADNAAPAEFDAEEAAAPLDSVPLPRPRPVAANLAASRSRKTGAF